MIKIDKSKVHFAAMSSEPANSGFHLLNDGFIPIQVQPNERRYSDVGGNRAAKK